MGASTTAGPSRLPFVLGFWRRGEPKCVATPVIPTPPPILPAQPQPTYAAYHDSHNVPQAPDGHFELGLTNTSRPLSFHSTAISSPPPYAPYGHEVIETRPGVYSVQEPPTLARMLFIYGFVFFPFWLAGIYILYSPLLPTEDWESGKSELEKEVLLRVLRDTEKKWARRCLWAMCSLAVASVLLIVIIKYAIMARA